MTQQTHSGPQSMGLWLQDQKYKGASCLWGMDTNRRDESTLSTLQRRSRVRGQNPVKPALPIGTISLLLIATRIIKTQNEVIFRQNLFSFYSRRSRSVSIEHSGQEGIAAFLHSVNESQIKCAHVSFPNVHLSHDFRFLLNIIIHIQTEENFPVFICM